MRSLIFRLFMPLVLVVSTSFVSAGDVMLPGERVYPGGVASARDGTLYVGSVRDGSLWRVTAGGNNVEQLPLTLGEVRSLALDERTQTLWACAGFAASDNTSAVLKAVDLRSNKVRSEYVLPDQGHCSDVAIGRDGTLYVVDGANSALLRMKKGDTAPSLWLANDDASRVQGNWSSVCTDNVGGLFLLSRDRGALSRITVRWDGSASKPVAIKLDRPLDQPQAMRLMAKRKLLVTEADGQLTRVDVLGETGRIVQMVSGIAVPGGITVVNGSAYVAETQAPGRNVEGRPRSFRLVKVDLPPL